MRAGGVEPLCCEGVVSGCPEEEINKIGGQSSNLVSIYALKADLLFSVLAHLHFKRITD
jgi:hypothetical protein